jgi:integrase/recombinase XerD
LLTIYLYFVVKVLTVKGGREVMHVIEIQTADQQRRFVVIDEEGNLIEPIVQYLKYLDRIGSARNTLRAYAIALRLYWQYLGQEGIDWQQITLDDLARFVLWLKVPSGSLKVLPARPVEQARSNRAINQTLSVVRSFYDYHWRMDTVSSNTKDKTATYLPAHTKRYKGFLHHITKGSPLTKNILRQKEEKRQRPKTITKTQVQTLLDACSNQRDRLLVRLLYESAMRVGEVLSLYVEDVDVSENRLHVCDRGPLENGAEIKSIHAPRSIDVSSDLIDEIVAYVGRVHTIEVETNHLFIKLHGLQAGQPLTYADVDSLFRRLRQKTGLDVTPHILRHSMLTRLAELGWQPELLQERAGHASFQQTYQTYIHPSKEALRAAWEQTQDQVCPNSTSKGSKSL